MNTISVLELQAIQAAKAQKWQTAIEANQEILKQNPTDINALNRLGVAYVQINEVGKAKEAFEHVLEIDKSNVLAKKHLERIKNHQSINLSLLPADEQFIEEPGKTRTVELHRLPGKEQLSKIAVGQICELKPKNRFISVDVDDTYLGSLPDDLSFQLTKLIKSGNKYVCYVRSISSSTCSVFIKETFRSEENQFVNSFPTKKDQASAMSDMLLVDESIPLPTEDIPLQMVDTDADTEEKALDSFPTDEMMEETPEEPEEN